MNNRAATALVATGMLVLAACSSDPAKTSGLFDEVKFKAGKAAVAAKTHQEPNKGTEQYCITRKNGVCKVYGVRPKSGTKTVTDAPAKPGKPDLYCVELDNVNGKPDDDDQWFEVTASTYRKWADASEGVKVTDMEYSVKGCSQ